MLWILNIYVCVECLNLFCFWKSKEDFVHPFVEVCIFVVMDGYNIKDPSGEARASRPPRCMRCDYFYCCIKTILKQLIIDV